MKWNLYYQFLHKQMDSLLGKFSLYLLPMIRGEKVKAWGKNVRKPLVQCKANKSLFLLPPWNTDTRQTFWNSLSFGDHGTTIDLSVGTFLICKTVIQKFWDFIYKSCKYISPFAFTALLHAVESGLCILAFPVKHIRDFLTRLSLSYTTEQYSYT